MQGDIMKLSNREKQICALLCKDVSVKEIAGKMGISPKTVQVHICNVFKKFKTPSRFSMLKKFEKYHKQKPILPLSRK